MVVYISSGESDSIDWSTDDEVETSSSVASATVHVPPNCESSTSGTKISDRFMEMGYPQKVVLEAIQEHGENDEEGIFNAILTYTGQNKYSQTMKFLEDMGFQYDEAFTAIDRCGLETPITNLVDFIHATKMEKEVDIQGLNDVGLRRNEKRQKVAEDKSLPNKRTRGKLMIGFGVPNAGITTVQRDIPAGAKGPPYFYYENVARTPERVWETIRRFLYEIEPEFVDSIHFSAAARKRGYIHNLPIDGRFPILPIPPTTTQEALPYTKKWWPKWDQRTQLNCIVIGHGSAEDTKRITEALDNSGPDPPEHVKKNVLEQCKRYNFVWVGKNKVAPLEPDEMELLMGYPKYHTRGGGISTTARYKCLGNSFQVDTVGYHLSVLKKLFPNGIHVLSLFSGIGGAEVALHRLGIPLKFVVSVESSETCRNILQSWWEQSNQQGKLIHIPDVKDVTLDKLKELMDMSHGFDLVIGGSPCNNLAGKNRFTRHGLYGGQSSLFFDYSRILSLVMEITPYRAHK